MKKACSKAKIRISQSINFSGFETPFEQQLITKVNRWIKLFRLISWGHIVNLYGKQLYYKECRSPISGCIVIGAVIIKHMLDLTDREMIMQNLRPPPNLVLVS